MAHGLMLCDDLIFYSRVRGTAESLGGIITMVKTPSALVEMLRVNPAQCVILDLQSPGLVIEEFVAELKRLTPELQIIGYGSHVEAETLRKARAAGCDVVMPRSAFVQRLPLDLGVWMGLPGPTSAHP